MAKYNDYWKSEGYEGGDNWLIDDITGFKIKSSEAQLGVGLEQGLLTSVRSELNPQLYLKPRTDTQLANLIRDRQTETFGEGNANDL